MPKNVMVHQMLRHAKNESHMPENAALLSKALV